MGTPWTGTRSAVGSFASGVLLPLRSQISMSCANRSYVVTYEYGRVIVVTRMWLLSGEGSRSVYTAGLPSFVLVPVVVSTIASWLEP